MNENQNNENKKKRFPSDRLKLHALLEKKEQELRELQDEVQELRDRVKQADFTAINATAAMYHVTPEMFDEIMRTMKGKRDQPVPSVPMLEAAASPLTDAEEEIPDEEDDSIDDEHS